MKRKPSFLDWSLFPKVGFQIFFLQNQRLFLGEGNQLGLLSLEWESERGEFKRKLLLLLVAMSHCGTLPEWGTMKVPCWLEASSVGLGITSALGPMKMSPSRAPAMTRTCLGLPTLQKRAGRTITFHFMTQHMTGHGKDVLMHVLGWEEIYSILLWLLLRNEIIVDFDFPLSAFLHFPQFL